MLEPMISNVALVHLMVAELHMGVVMFLFIALVVRLLTDLVVRGRTPSARVQAIRVDSDIVAYIGSIAAVFFLILSGVTGYLIQPYSDIVNDTLLMNKSLTALAALFFFAAYVYLRARAGPTMWNKRGLYAVAFITAALGTFFTAMAGSIGGELTVGQSVMDPLYKALSFSFSQWQVGPTEIAVTAALIVVGIIFALVLRPAHAKSEKQAPAA
jgi:hypothetical protein